MARCLLPRICVGGHATSSGRVRCFDSPEPQASPSARPGCRPSHLQLQQGRAKRRCKPSRRGPASHRLQPGVPLPGRAQSESRLFTVLERGKWEKLKARLTFRMPLETSRSSSVIHMVGRWSQCCGSQRPSFQSPLRWYLIDCYLLSDVTLCDCIYPLSA